MSDQTDQASVPHGDLLLSTDQVCSILQVSRTTLWRLEHTTDFPKAVVFGKRIKRWRRREVEAYVSAGAPA